MWESYRYDRTWSCKYTIAWFTPVIVYFDFLSFLRICIHTYLNPNVPNNQDFPCYPSGFKMGICFSTLLELLHLLLGPLFYFRKHGREIVLSRPPLVTILLSGSIPLTSNDIILVIVKLTALCPTSLCSLLPLLLIKQQIRKLKLYVNFIKISKLY